MSGTTWYAARAAGILAYVLLSSGALLGILMAKRTQLRWPKFAVQEVHRYLTILTGVFLALHVAAVLADPVVPFSLRQVLVPFASSYRPLATGLGVVALELLAAVAVTNLLRKRLPYRGWRRAHFLTFAVWAAATVHGVLAGTDRRDPWFLVLYGGAVCAVAAAASLRFAPRAAGGLAAAVSGAAVLVLALAALPQAAPGRRHVARAFSAPLTGTVRQGASDGVDQLVSIVGRARGRRPVAFRVDLLVEGNVVRQSALQLSFAGGSRCAGTVEQLGTDGLVGTCSGRAVRATWRIDGGGAIRGRLQLA